ncbi:hypothetical protein HYH02_004444 [Chlamydomonas schloesseri]|uniref:DUF4350 domain-containing protein n=1 Tax=Chlamydomonas schloesseri TaxID=2026947 RepID=A0A835WNP9_9CHLO|nr:hypothetical protein HYH02_004444 [Chlamydomonas schloesseri]|eukprot:KAG2450604.1 hypothetical protein HYH02_004444 [Chlamydomonas schloesseri]
MAGSRIAWLALLGLALVATARASAPRVLLYNSSRVVASSLRTDLIVGLINDQVAGVSIRTTKSQPYLHELSAFSAYVIPANDKQPYLEAEDAGFNLWKPLELREYVQAGGSLVLLDGSTGHNPRPGSSGNSFTGMLDLLLGAEGAAHCKGYLYGRDLLMYLRLAGEGALGNIHTPIMVKPNRGLSGLACTGDQPGEPIYSGRADGSADAGLSAARLWRLGQGRIIWIGSSYTMPKIRAFREVLTAAIEDSQLPDLTLTRSPPPSPPPPRPPPPGKTPLSSSASSPLALASSTATSSPVASSPSPCPLSPTTPSCSLTTSLAPSPFTSPIPAAASPPPASSSPALSTPASSQEVASSSPRVLAPSR